MGKRVLVDGLVGVALAFGSLIFQYGAYLLLLVTGFSPTYESAPPDPGSHPDWMTQINLMSLVAAVPVLVVTFVAAWLLNTRGFREGMRRGLIWAAVALAWNLVLGFGNGTLAMFGVPGLWVFLVAFAVGPSIAGSVRSSRPAREFAR